MSGALTEGAPAEPGFHARPRDRRTAPWILVLAILVGYALVGLVAGFVWEAVWAPPHQIVHQHAVYYTDYESLRRVFTGTGLYALIGAVASALTALVTTLLTRRRELLVMGVVLVGSALAGVVMWKTGVSRGPVDPMTIAATAADDTLVDGQLQVSGQGPFVVWPMVSMLVLSLVFFGWPRDGLRSSKHAAGIGPATVTDSPEPGMDDRSRR